MKVRDFVGQKDDWTVLRPERTGDAIILRVGKCLPEYKTDMISSWILDG